MIVAKNIHKFYDKKHILNGIDVKIEENQSKLQKLRFQKALQQLEDPLEIRSLKKEIAQLLTLKSEYSKGIRLDKETG